MYVGNLSFNSTEETVREAFAKHGEVSEVHLVIDRDTGRLRGFGFVTMGCDGDAAKAKEMLNGMQLDGRTLKVDEARQRQPRGGRHAGGGQPGREDW